MVAPLLGAISRPFQEATIIAEDIAGISHLRSEIASLRQENARLREWYQAALALEAENKSLQELLNIKVSSGYSFVTGRVISDSGNAYVHSMLVTAGSGQGVEKGQAVLSGEGLIGRIVETGDKLSRILLLTDFNSRIPVLIQGSKQKAIMAGTNKKYPVLQYLQRGTNIREGSRVVTSGDGGIFPPGVPVGIVELGPGGNHRIKVFADLSKIIHVRIIDNHSDNGVLIPGR
jgi:rod shape-determining protein MreC